MNKEETLYVEISKICDKQVTYLWNCEKRVKIYARFVLTWHWKCHDHGV